MSQPLVYVDTSEVRDRALEALKGAPTDPPHVQLLMKDIRRFLKRNA
jgi:hypothetical protein